MGDLAVGATLDDDGGSAHGAVWMLFFNGACTGNEILEASCEPRRRGGMIKATLMQGQPRTTATFRLDGNSKTDIRKNVKKNGNAKAKFKHVPKGEFTVELLVCNRQIQTICR